MPPNSGAQPILAANLQRQPTQSLWSDHIEGTHVAHAPPPDLEYEHPSESIEKEAEVHLGLKSVSLAYLRKFVNKHGIKAGTSTAQVVKTVIKPATASDHERSYADLPELKPHLLHSAAQHATEEAAGRGRTPRPAAPPAGLPGAVALMRQATIMARRPPYHYVVHNWQRPFLELVTMLEAHFKGQPADDVYVWVDVFAVPQHGSSGIIQLQRVQRAIWYASSTLVCLDAGHTVLGRMWCLYEMFYTLIVKNSSMALLALLPPGAPAMTTAKRAAVYAALDAAHAKCSSKSDQAVLRQSVDAHTRRGMAAVNNYIKSGLLLPPYDHDAIYLKYYGEPGGGCLPCLSASSGAQCSPLPPLEPMPALLRGPRAPVSVAGKKQLRLILGACNIPHPAKADRGGEDAYFLSAAGGGALGVADGVGSWSSDDGIDPALYSRDIMAAAARCLEQQEAAGAEQLAVRQVLSSAHLGVKHAGSCTACMAMLPAGSSVLQVANLGDSGLRLIRGGEIAAATRAQCHSHNLPYQLACPDEPICDTDCTVQADVYHLALEPGDVVVMATDGMLDNMWVEQMMEIVHQIIEMGKSGPLPSSPRFDANGHQLPGQTSIDDASALAAAHSLGGSGHGGQAAAAALAATIASHSHITAAGDDGERIQANASVTALSAGTSSALAACIARTLARTAASNMLRSDFRSPFASELAKLSTTPWEFKQDPRGGKPDDVTVVVAMAVEDP